MSWLALIIIGAILWAIGYWAPLPHPLGTILQIIGGIMVLVGVILLVLGLIGTGVQSGVDVDGMRAILQL